MVASLEQKFLPVPVHKSPQADAIVVLGGSVAIPDSPRLEVELTGTSDRILHAARLYRAGKAPLVVATGGGFKFLTGGICHEITSKRVGRAGKQHYH